MSLALEIIQSCEFLGVKISVSGQNLKIDAPIGLPFSIKDALRQHKTEIIRAVLKQEQIPLLSRQSSVIQYDITLDASRESFEFYDVFTIENKSGQRVINYLHAYSKKREKAGMESLFLDMPTIRAFESEMSLVKGIDRHCKGSISNKELKIFIEDYIKTHSIYADTETEWTGNDVPLFYVVIKHNNERLEECTCNPIQAWMIREFWLRVSPESHIEMIKL